MFISKGVIRSLSLTTKFPSETRGELSGALRNNQLFRAVISMSLKNAMHFF